MSNLRRFSEAARKLARNPIGVISLFVTLVYGVAVLLFTFGKSLGPAEKLPLLWFLILFPIVVLAVFTWLVVCHYEKLYAPGDFQDEQHFVEIFGRHISEFKEFEAYKDVDTLYFNLLKLAVMYPSLIDSAKTKNYAEAFGEQDLLRYQSYAYISWNICETIFDRRANPSFFETWLPVIKAENSLHRCWFDNPENHIRFKASFREFIASDAKSFPKS